MLLSRSYILVWLCFPAGPSSLSAFSTVSWNLFLFFLRIFPVHLLTASENGDPSETPSYRPAHQCQDEAPSSQPRTATFRSSPLLFLLQRLSNQDKGLSFLNLFPFNLPSFPASLPVSPPLHLSLNPALEKDCTCFHLNEPQAWINATSSCSGEPHSLGTGELSRLGDPHTHPFCQKKV